MKKLWLSGITLILLNSYVFSQAKYTVGRAGKITDIIGNSVRLEPLVSTHVAGMVLAINSAGDMVEVAQTSGGSVPIATLSTVGIVKPDGTTTTIDPNGTLHAIATGTGEPIILPGTVGQYWRYDKTWQNLVLAAITNWPSPVGQGGKFLSTDGTNYSWAAAAGGSGLADAYATMTDGTTPATASGATTFKFRSANNRISLATANNDVTHGDNLLVTFNEGNVVLAQSQVTGLVAALSGKQATITAGTNLQYLKGDFSLGTLNTTAVPEGSNQYYTALRVTTLGNTLWTPLSFHDNLDALANVLFTSLQINDIPKWNGSKWINVPIPSGGGSAPTITLSGDVTGSGTPGITTTIAAGVVANSKLANMATATFKGRVTAGTGVPEDINMAGARGMLSINNIDNTSDVSKPISTAVQTALNLKMNIANGSPTGVFDASGASNVKLPRVTDATLQRDTTGFGTFGGGSAITGDTLWVTTSTVLGSFYNTGTDTLVVTNMNVVMQGSSPSVTVSVLYGTSLNTGGTALVTAGTAVTNTTTGTNVTSFNNTKIPPGNHVWAKLTTVTTGSKPTYLNITLSGTKSRKG